jgi:CPA1 family monovalent cation:H+ antiporter
MEHLQLTMITAKAAQEELQHLLQFGSLSKSLYEELFATYQARIAAAEKDLRELYNQRMVDGVSTLEEQGYLDSTLRRLYLAEKGAINDALRQGLLSDEMTQGYMQALDEKLLSLKDD